MDFPEPTTPHSDRRDVLLGYLDYFRHVIRAKVEGLSDAQVRSRLLPSGWSPIELVWHLVNVERRWFDWGFAGERISDPWADQERERWHVQDRVTLDVVLAQLDQRAARTRALVLAHDLEDVGRPGPRWNGAAPATLERVLLHVIQEYARHAGHLDVVRELLDCSTGEGA